MFVIIGILIVIGAIVGGYLMEHGNLRVLMQPAELLIIGGAAIGTVLIANPLHILKKIAAGLVSVFGGSKFPRQRYLDSLKMMYELLNKARKEGLVALESDIEAPDKSRRSLQVSRLSSKITIPATSFATPCAWQCQAVSNHSTWINSSSSIWTYSITTQPSRSRP